MDSNVDAWSSVSSSFFLEPISREEQTRISQLVQHLPGGEANPEWLASRVGRATGSAVGAIYGVNKYCSPDKKLDQMVWQTFKGNKMTRYGNLNEHNAEESFDNWMQMRLYDEETDDFGFVLTGIELQNRGLCVCRQEPIFAMSPDGFLVETWTKEVKCATKEEAEQAAINAQKEDVKVGDGRLWFNYTVEEDGLVKMAKTCVILVEYKCPWKGHAKGWYDEFDVYPVERIKKAKNVELPVPSYYYSQVQHGMNVLGIRDNMITRPEKTYFVVWHPAYYNDGETPLDFWTTTNPSKTSTVVAGPTGTIFITDVPYDHDYAEDLIGAARTFVLDRLLPTLYRKEKGLLENGEVDEVVLINMDEPKKRQRTKFAAARKKEEDTEDHASTFESMGFVFHSE
jgi:hypothetical protein